MSSRREPLRVGDVVGWNSEAGHVSGTIIRVHTRDFDYKGHTHRATPASPQYEIKSSKTDHIAAHKAAALTRLTDRHVRRVASGKQARND